MHIAAAEAKDRGFPAGFQDLMSLDGGRHIVDVVDDVVLYQHVAATEIHLDAIAVAPVFDRTLVVIEEVAAPDVADAVTEYLHATDVADLNTVPAATDEVEVLDGHVRDGLENLAVHCDAQVATAGGILLAVDGERLARLPPRN